MDYQLLRLNGIITSEGKQRLESRLFSSPRSFFPAPLFFTIYSLLLGLFGNAATSYAQPVTSCSGCTAKEVGITAARLIPPPAELNCTPGNPVSATLAVTVTAKDNVKRYGIYLSATLKVGSTETVVDFCSPQSFSKSTEFYIPVTWTCGAAVEIGNVFLAWGVKKADNICAGGFSCSNIVKSKCAKSTQIISVAQPLVADFTSATSCIGATAYLSVTATATGGTKSPDGSYPSGTLDAAGTTFSFTGFSGPIQTTSIATPGNQPVSFTVTDAAGITDVETRMVTVGACPVAPPLVADFTTATSCIGTTTYISVTATATGGTKTPAGAYPSGTLDVAGTTFSFTGFSGPIQTTSTATPGNQPVSFTVTDANGITDVETKTVFVGSCPSGARTGVAERVVDDEMAVRTYPNPHNGRVFLQITSPVDGMADIDWYTTSGSKVDALKVNVQKGINEPIGYDVKGNDPQLIYRVRIDGKSTSGTILSGK